MMDFLSHYKWWLLLTVLLVVNALVYWPVPKSTSPIDGPPPLTGQISHELPGNPSVPTQANDPRRQKFEAAMAKLSEEDRQKVRSHMETVHAFFDSIRNLPEQDRRQKVADFMAQNPPPQIEGWEMGPPGSGPENGESGGKGPHGPHVPDPGVRRSMDQNIANSQS